MYWQVSCSSIIFMIHVRCWWPRSPLSCYWGFMSASVLPIFYWNGYFICSSDGCFLTKTRQIYGWNLILRSYITSDSPFFVFFFFLNMTIFFIIGLILLIFIKLFMFFKWIKLFFHQLSAAFLLILYFCALEIIPCLLLYQGMIQVNNVLLIKI